MAFDHDYFWQWAKRQENIFVSEYSAPRGWFDMTIPQGRKTFH